MFFSLLTDFPVSAYGEQAERTLSFDFNVL